MGAVEEGWYGESVRCLRRRGNGHWADRMTSDMTAGGDAGAKRCVAAPLADVGYVPVELRVGARSRLMEVPRRADAVYGSEDRAADRQAVVAAVATRAEIPLTLRLPAPRAAPGRAFVRGPPACGALSEARPSAVDM